MILPIGEVGEFCLVINEHCRFFILFALSNQAMCSSSDLCIYQYGVAKSSC